MRILFIADVPLENPTSGSEQVLYQQATGLAREGMEVYAITRQAALPSWIIRDVTGVREGSYCASAQDMIHSFFSLWKYPFKFYGRFIEGAHFQVAVCHQPFNCFSLLMMRKLQHMPLLYVFHSPSHEEYLLSHRNKSVLRNLLHVKTRRMIERVCLKRAVKIMVLSRYMEEKVRDIHGITANRIVVNPGGVELNRFKPSQNREALKNRLGFPEGKIHLLTIRNLEARMGIENLLRSIHILKKGQAGIHLVLGGEGIERQNLEKMIKDLGLREEVSMTGFIPSRILPEYYGAADFFILPTRHLEGFGLVTPESMACGTPVLGTPVGGTKEILSHFDPEFLFSDTSAEAMAKGIQKAIERHFAWKKEYDDLRVRCREYAATNYSWGRHLAQLKSILEEIISGRCGPMNV
ncbi:MAG: glycosyltransferase family 4 protein [Deltaproteobacteria bacterium]|nr:MAG: glycosyltransferase family 4 protein [Deltaproteobacteria bacterium]